MNRCLITMEEIPEGSRYSPTGLKRLDARLADLQPLPYTLRSSWRKPLPGRTKCWLGACRPKLSAVLRIKENRLPMWSIEADDLFSNPARLNGRRPANEALTMTLAEHSGIEVPAHGLVEATDGSMVYFIRRFDRVGQGERLPLEDGARLGHTRGTKYNSSMEQVIAMIEQHCTFPVIEKRKLMQRVWFSFLTGNEDMHLKNWSLLRPAQGVSH